MTSQLEKLRKAIREKWVPDFDFAVYEAAPWTPFEKEIAACTVALVSTSGVYLKDSQPPFQENAGRGDHSFRQIPSDARAEDLAIAHEHYDHANAELDINVVFPIERLRELKAEGRIGEIGPYHYTVMGYIPIWRPLVEETAPEIASRLKRDGVDAVFLNPV